VIDEQIGIDWLTIGCTRTAAPRFSLDLLVFLVSGFAASARLRRRSVILFVGMHRTIYENYIHCTTVLRLGISDSHGAQYCFQAVSSGSRLTGEVSRCRADISVSAFASDFVAHLARAPSGVHQD
jgi:hypothetical protein